MTAVRMLWGPASNGFGVGSYQGIQTLALNDSDNSAAAVFLAERSGTINAIGVRASARTGTPPSYNVGLVTVDADGFPTSTAYGGSAAESYDFTTTGWHWVTLTTPATVGAGDAIAARIWPTASAPDGSNFITLATRGGPRQNLPATKEFAAAWAHSLFYPLIAVRYSDAPGQIVPFSGTAFTMTWQSSGSPDEMGCLFQVPFVCAVQGVRILTQRAAGLTNRIRIYNAADGVLAETTLDLDHPAETAIAATDVFFDTINLAADTNYRLTVEAMEASNRGVDIWTFPDAASRAAMPEGSRWQRTHRTDAGAWTNVTTELHVMALWLSDITISSGGGAHPGTVFSQGVQRL